jgi:6-phosphogluconate dehydrogenase
MIGAGRMGANMVRRLLRGGHACVVHSSSPAKLEPLVTEGAIAAATLAALVAQMPPPRTVWLMIPAAAVDATIDALAPLFDRGDTIVDGGNCTTSTTFAAPKHWRRGIHYLDVGCQRWRLGSGRATA